MEAWVSIAVVEKIEVSMGTLDVKKVKIVSEVVEEPVEYVELSRMTTGVEVVNVTSSWLKEE